MDGKERGMAWFKWYENAVTDAKLQCVARISGQPVAFVVAVWAMLLERASAAGERGSIAGFDCESADAALQMPEGAGCAIFDAFKVKGMVAGDRIAKWEARQEVRRRGRGGEARSGAERQRDYRERKKLMPDGPEVSEVSEAAEAVDAGGGHGRVTECNGALRDVTESNGALRNVTGCNDALRNVTECDVTGNASLKDKIREDKIREEILTPLPPFERGEGMAGAPPLDAGLERGDPPGPALKGAREKTARPRSRKSHAGRRELEEACMDYAKEFAASRFGGQLADALQGFVNFRLRCREPFTLDALRLTFRDLDRHAAQAREPVLARVEMLERSVQRGWRGVFPPREEDASWQGRSREDGRRRLNPQDEDRRQMAIQALRSLRGNDDGGMNGNGEGHGADLVALAGNG